MIKKKKIIPIVQLFLLIIGLALIDFTYYYDKTNIKIDLTRDTTDRREGGWGGEGRCRKVEKKRWSEEK